MDCTKDTIKSEKLKTESFVFEIDVFSVLWFEMFVTALHEMSIKVAPFFPQRHSNWWCDDLVKWKVKEKIYYGNSVVEVSLWLSGKSLKLSQRIKW